MEVPEYTHLTPDDLLDLVLARDLTWHSGPQSGIAFHMVSALAVAGQVGLTAIGDTPRGAEEEYARAKRALDEESRCGLA